VELHGRHFQAGGGPAREEDRSQPAAGEERQDRPGQIRTAPRTTTICGIPVASFMLRRLRRPSLAPGSATQLNWKDLLERLSQNPSMECRSSRARRSRPESDKERYEVVDRRVRELESRCLAPVVQQRVEVPAGDAVGRPGIEFRRPRRRVVVGSGRVDEWEA